MEVLQKKRIQFLLFVVGVIVLSITAEKCREVVGQEAASKSGQFTLLNCFDGSSGTLACVVKEGVKLYFNNIRSMHMESRRNRAIEDALADAVAQGMAAKDAAKFAQKEGAKAAKLAKQEAKRIIGPIISSGWDFFEALYYGGTITEGFLRGTGTFFGTSYVGFIGEERFGKFGYLVGSHLGSWVGGRIGLMVYDVVNGIHYMYLLTQSPETISYEDTSSGKDPDHNDLGVVEVTEDSSIQEPTQSSVSDEFNSYDTQADASLNDDNDFDTSEVAEDSYIQESTTGGDSEESNSYETPADENFRAHEEL